MANRSWPRLVRLPLLLAGGLVVAGAALAGCNYTGDMNVQPYKSSYNATYVRPPLPGYVGAQTQPSPAASPVPPRPQPSPIAGWVPSVPVNPTPENYFGVPYRPLPTPTAIAGLRPAAEGLADHPYIGFAPPVIDANNPTPNNQASVQRGMVLYQSSCLPCHGPQGQGNGIVGAWFARPPVNRAPANLTSPQVQSLPDSHLYEVVTQGFGAMPSLAYELQPSEVWDVIHYVRTLRAP